MAISDFFYYGTRVKSNYNSVSGIWCAPSFVARSLGADHGSGAHGATGEPALRTSYSNPLGSFAGDYCRMLRNSTAGDHPMQHNGSLGYIGGGFLNSAAGGTSYPMEDAPSVSNLVSQSVRAFLRLDGSNLQRCGSSVNMVIKAKVVGNGGSQFADGGFNGTSEYNDKYGVWSGYQIGLSSLINRNTNDSSGYGRNGAPVLRFIAPEEGDANTGTGYYEENSANSFSYNTWYHVRMDVIPSVSSGDTIKIYTAPVTGPGSAAEEGIGSETWTLDMTINIATSADYYHTWGTNYKWAGYTFTAAQNGGSSPWENDCHDASIDSFQFLTKDIS